MFFYPSGVIYGCHIPRPFPNRITSSCFLRIPNYTLTSDPPSLYSQLFKTMSHKVVSVGAVKRIFYGWYIVGAGCAMQFVQSTLFFQSFGTYFAVLRDDRGWSKTELSGAAAMHQVEAAILGPLLGWIIDRFGSKWVIRVGVIMFGTGFIILSCVDSLLAFYGAFIVTALGSSLCGFFPLNVALIHWFKRHLARSMSSMQIGMALGGLVLPVVALALSTWGWRATAFASGIIIIAVCLPLSFVIRRRPEDIGEVIDGIRFR
jgi:MFS family permease